MLKQSVTQQIPIAAVIVNGEGNPRSHFDEQKLLDLGESMRENSQLSPIIVNQVDNDYYLVAGERRLRAAMKGEAETIEAKVFEDLTPLEAARMAIAENRDREPLNVIEGAYAYERLFDLGVKIKEIAVSEKCSEEKVARRLELLKLPASVQLLMTREKYPLPIHQGLLLRKLKTESDQTQMARKAAPIGGPVASEDMVRRWVDDKIQPKIPGANPHEDDPEGNGGGDPPAANENTPSGNDDPPMQTPAEQKKAAKDILKMKPVDVVVGIKGKLAIDEFGQACLTKTTMTFNVKGDVEILSTAKLVLDLEGEELVKIVKLVKKAQPKPAKKKKAKKKVAKK